ncbi:ABC transporter substrate-binding protein [Agrobacterium deltaense]|uniref:ABC-type dipeptide transport system, periplasmic component n=2 Tax=Agrobacterium TaxID=357 RepID=A0A1S7UBP1_9HYPH|nr:ABC transporter substrate-binding protein [Agrobacterium deltaense]CVI64232.1 ABC-type dipeptide transport system, periplasmic component [Agrobacterium deltaense NCPPB 1641]
MPSSHDDWKTSRRNIMRAAAALGAGFFCRTAFADESNTGIAETFRYGLSAYPPELRPFEDTGAAGRAVKSLMFRGLLSFDERGSLQSELAEAWVLTDPRTYIFRLRPNALFQNGAPVTANDVKYSIDAIRAKNSVAALREQFQDIESVEIVDTKTVKLVLKQPTPSFLGLLAAPPSAIVFAGQSDDPNKMVGAGPYLLESFEKGASLTLKARADFYKAGLPKSKVINFIVYADDSLRVAALQAGDVDIIEYVPFQSMQTLADTPGISLQSSFGLFMSLQFNLAQGPFTNPLVRRAVAHAIKRDDIVAAAFYGQGKSLYGLPMPLGSPFDTDDLAHLWPYDPPLAKRLLQEAGAENVAATLLSTSTYGFHKDTAEIIQQHLATVGLNIKLALPEWGVRMSQAKEGRYHLLVNGSRSLSDPDELSGFLASNAPGGSYGHKDPEIDALLSRGRHEADLPTRIGIYKELQRIVAEKTPIAFLNYRRQAYAVRQNLKGFKALPDHLVNLSGYALERAYLEKG